MVQLPLSGMPAPTRMGPWPESLRVPHWDQLNDPEGPFPEPDPASLTDCGEECVSMLIKACTGRYTTEGQVRRLMGKPDNDGRSGAGDLIEALRQFAILSHLQEESSHLRLDLRWQLQERRPAILLGRYVSPAELHWVVAIGYGDGHLYFNDPWRGLVRSMPWSWVTHWSAGLVVMVDHECQVVRAMT